METLTFHSKPWNRAIILVDMNAFFASVEQLDYPSLQGKPVGVTNGEQGTCIITASYEARHYGVKTGMRLREARRLCPKLIQRPARPRRYAAISRTIMDALNSITPDLEVFSIDEAFLDVTHCQRLFGTPEHMAKMTKECVYEASGLLCSVGVSGDKTTAKFAAKLIKPDGLTVIPPWEAKARLRYVPVTELCGIADGIGSFLKKRGVYYCGDMEKLPIGVLSKRFGNLGRRIWAMCQGQDPEPVNLSVPAPKSMGHGKVMPPNTRELTIIKTFLLHMSEKLAARLRRHEMQAQVFFIGLRSYALGWLGGNMQSIFPTDDGQRIYQLALSVLESHWAGEGVSQVQITALDPKPRHLQYDLFFDYDESQHNLHRAIDTINERYGEFSVSPARLLMRSKMPNVISPSWKPSGQRQTV